MEILKYPLSDYTIFFLVIAIISSRLIRTFYTPMIQMITRWIMRLSTCMFLSLAIVVLTTQHRPLWVIFLTMLLGYLLLESIYIWILIKMYSRIDFPLFPRFSPESETIIWPNGKYAQKTRNMIQKAGFKFSETLSIKSPTISIMLSPIFYNNRGNIRLQVIFPNFQKKRTLMSFILTTYLRNGTILVTHNIQSPASLFFTAPFQAKFRSIISIKKLIKLHKKVIKKYIRQSFCLSGENCQQAINHEQLLLEEMNLSNGNCEQINGNSNINLSFAGRYKLWINTLRLSYIGR